MSNVKIKTMSFSNILSYGDNNVIDFSADRVTQLVGKNGAGKSSIATILEEGLYNKNSRGIKKDSLFNWNSKEKCYKISINFTKDEDVYLVTKVVKSTAKVELFKNGEVISGHTATQTYKLIEDIIGCDFATFTKLVYQSIGSSLDFLRTTDANRKAFLTGLFSHEIYKEISEDVKKDAKLIKTDLDKEQGKLSAIESTIARATAITSMEVQEYVPVPEFDEAPLREQITEARVKAALASETRTKINKLINLDKDVQAAKESLEPFENLPALTDVSEQLSQVTRDLTVVTAEADKVKKRYQSFKKQSEVCACPTCGKPIDISDAVNAAEIAKKEYDPLFQKRTLLETSIKELREKDKEFKAYVRAASTLDKAVKAKSLFVEEVGELDITEQVQGIITESESLVSKLTKDISKMKSEVALAIEHNSSVDVANAKVTAMREQLELANKDLDTVQSNVDTLSKELSDLEILATSFKDLVSYKLEHSVKVFEDLINTYLSIITGGKFALGFELDATKLLVVIFNDGIKTSIESCSTGQQHRIQLATLLAIRSLMSAISKVNINVLFLDEVISFIDTQGINTLVELLMEEHELNSYLVSHGHTHPLAKIVTVEQDEQGNSRLA